jgi:serine/threonine protein kinase
MTLAPGATVDRYRLIAPAGQGGQGTVWRAEDPLKPGSLVALKLLPISLAPPASMERFRREARALARLTHPSLPRCHALFEDLKHDVVGIALDFIDGSPLSVLIASERLDRGLRRRVLSHLAAALAFVHEAGLVHRDVKPQNVMIAERFFESPDDPTGVKLVDFGIAAEPHNPNPLTATGSVMGTIEYLAPELLDRGHWQPPFDGPERDVFALGVLAYELLLGKHPTGLSADAALGDYLVAYRQHANGPFPEGVEGDPHEAFYRATLALRSAARAPNGAAVEALLAELDPTAGAAPRAALGHARTEPVDPALLGPYSMPRRSRARSFALYSSYALGTAALFGVSFYATFTRKVPMPPAVIQPALAGLDRDKASPTAEEPPNPSVPAKPSRPPRGAPPPAVTASSPAVTASSPPAAPTANVPVAFPTTMACPDGMVPIAGPPPFCLDQKEVTVAEYRKCGACGPAKEAYWTGPTFTDQARGEQSAHCTNGREGSESAPVNCVSLEDARAYCASVGKRLPRMEEWRKGRSSIQLCVGVDGVCPMFEWSSDPTHLPGYRQTRGPSFRYPSALEGSNVEVARNDDLGFRCAKDPAPR